MKPLKFAASGIGIFAVAAACVAVGGWGAYSTHRFAAGAEKVTGSVFYSTNSESNTLLVRLDEGGASGRMIPVRAAWWTLPWDYMEGGEVTISYDPAADYDALLFPDRALIDTWPQLYLTSTLWIAAGVILAAVAVAAKMRSANIRLTVRVE